MIPFNHIVLLLVEKIELVCKYDSKRVYLTNELAEKCDYIIIKNLDDGKIGVLCLVKNGNTYHLRSSQIFDSIDDSLDTFSKYLSNQVVLIYLILIMILIKNLVCVQN